MIDIKEQLAKLGPSKIVTGSTDLKVTVTLEEMFGNVRISWDIDPKYPINNAVAQISRTDGVFFNHVIDSHQGYFDSNFPWGTGFFGTLWGWNVTYIYLVSTPRTV